jgi:hypothetical protein
MKLPITGVAAVPGDGPCWQSRGEGAGEDLGSARHLANKSSDYMRVQ